MKKFFVKNMGYIEMCKYKRKCGKLNSKLHTIISKKDLVKKIENYKYLKTFLNIKEKNKIYTIDPIELLSPLNFDIFVKYLYIKNKNNNFAKMLYLRHLEIFNNFK